MLVRDMVFDAQSTYCLAILIAFTCILNDVGEYPMKLGLWSVGLSASELS